ncbi:hypothetical protein AB205_0026680, partial [Aquarana catesbeiana]
MSLERGRNTGRQIGIHVPKAAAYCQVVSSGNDEGGGDGDDDEVIDATWVPDRAEEETEGEAAQPQGGRHQERVESSHPIPSHSAAVIFLAHSPKLSCLGLFQHICSRSHCCYLQTVSQAHQTLKNTNHLGT